jgi:hypothetical protein
MGSDEGMAQYMIRVVCECIHARWRNWDLRQVTVRGLEKVRAVVLLYAFTNNLLQGYRLVLRAISPPPQKPHKGGPAVGRPDAGRLLFPAVRQP